MSEELTFGSWLRQRRKELSITQEELAEQLGISWITLRKLETGERHPSGQIALLLADYLRLPSDERQAFVAFARTGRTVSGDASLSAPWRNALLRQTNLPALLTSLIGREREEVAVQNHLLNSKVRLLTLIGPPGIGKTRLGVHIASNVVDHFEHGAYFVDLAPVMDPELVLPAIARTFGLKETAQQPLESLLLDYIRQRRMLLLLDNFEQILDASTEVVKLLEASPWLKVLITSREALQVRGERRFFVPPLGVPDLHHLPVLDKLAGYPSVELFLERARAVAPDFTLVEANAQDVAAVCVGLEGLPLAIELAASRANRLSPAEMRVALASRLKLLRAETRDLPARHRTVRGAIKWSYDLLDDEEQKLFRRLGVFVGGFTPEAVAAMSDVGNDGRDVTTTPDTLYLLVDKSLVRQKVGAEGEDLRFVMLETIHEYSREKLEESGEAEALHMQHARYFMRLAEEAELHLMGNTPQEWLARLEAEHDNFRVALRWAVSSEPEIGLRTAGALRQFWDIRGYHSEGREVLHRLLSEAERLGCSREARVNALNTAGLLAYRQGEYEAARSTLEQALEVGSELGDRQSMAFSLHHLGNVALEQHEYVSARTLYQESLALRKELGDKWGIAYCLNNLGSVAYLQGDYPAAKSLYEESLVLFREEGDKWGIAVPLIGLGSVAYLQGDYPAARSWYEEGLVISKETGSKQQIAIGVAALGGIAAATGEPHRGARLLCAASALLQEIGCVLETEDRTLYEAWVASARSQLGEDAFERASKQGRAMPLEEAAAYALEECGSKHTFQDSGYDLR